jgi:hypothetical protein
MTSQTTPYAIEATVALDYVRAVDTRRDPHRTPDTLHARGR